MREHVHEAPQAVVFNLGWLPGAAHAVTTRTETTLAAVTAAAELVAPGGIVTVCIYPGHEEGQRELAALLRGLQCHVNLIPANEIVESSHKRSTAQRLERFISILNSRGINATVRRSLGSDIDASCGQLRSRQSREMSPKEGKQ